MTTERIVSVIEAFPMPVVLIGPDDRVKAANVPVDGILGANLVGKHYMTALRQPSVIDAIAQVRISYEPRSVRFTGRDGARDTIFRVAVAGG